MFAFDWSGEHTHRAREHIIEEMSLNFLERKGLDPDQRTTTIRMPWSRKITVKSIDRFREMSLERMHLER